MNECSDYHNDPMAGKRRIVCAAIRNDGEIVLGIRHHDKMMNRAIENFGDAGGYWMRPDEEQGFVDQWGNFLNREDALIVARTAGQILRVGAGWNATKELFSENLY